MTAADINSADGDAGFSEAGGGTISLTGRGGNIGGAADACRFVSQTVAGDFTFTARIIDRTGPVQKLGLMARANADPDSPAVAFTLGEIGGRQARFGVRAAKGGKWSTQLGNDYTTVPAWFRLQRSGRTFTAFQSSDGAAWFKVGQADTADAASYAVGLAVSSAKPGDSAATAVFDHVAFTVRPPEAPATPTSLKAAAGKQTVTLTWANAAANQAGIRIERSDDGKLFYEVASLPGDAKTFVNTGVTSAFHYRIRACNTGGFSDYTTPVVAKPMP
ncbi:MAG: hypothetical protein QM754_00165 [Tepidisphaeraceae bacterium]